MLVHRCVFCLFIVYATAQWKLTNTADLMCEAKFCLSWHGTSSTSTSFSKETLSMKWLIVNIESASFTLLLIVIFLRLGKNWMNASLSKKELQDCKTQITLLRIVHHFLCQCAVSNLSRNWRTRSKKVIKVLCISLKVLDIDTWRVWNGLWYIIIKKSFFFLVFSGPGFYSAAYFRQSSICS